MSRTYRDRTAEYFKAHAGQWIDGLVLEDIGGKYAWRTRVSDCRKQLNMCIENRLITLPNGSKRSLYRYAPAGQQDLFQGAA
jgi:hypothetical protein